MPRKQTQLGASAKRRATGTSSRSAAASSASSARRSPARSSSTSPARTAARTGARSSARPRTVRDAASRTKPGNGAPRFTLRGLRDLRGLQWWLLPLVISIGLALFVLGYYPVARVQYQAVRERARLRAELQAVQARNTRLQARVDRLKSPEGIEEEARRQFGLVHKGETLGIVIDGDETSDKRMPRIDSDEVTVAPTGPWTAFLDHVFGVTQ